MICYDGNYDCWRIVMSPTQFFKKTKTKILVALFLCAFAGLVDAMAQMQTPMSNPRRLQNDGGVTESDRWNSRVMSRDGMLRRTIWRTSVNTPGLLILRRKAEKMLTPTEADRSEFADFLDQPKTGIFRLAPMVSCMKMVDASDPDNPCIYHYAEGRGIAYSFRKKEHTPQIFADIARTDGTFRFPGRYVLGLINMVGDVPLDKLDVRHPLVDALGRFEPETKLNAIIDQQREINAGKMIGDSQFYGKAPIRQYATYLVRIIAYRPKYEPKPIKSDMVEFLETQNRKDLIVAFRVARVNEDGSLLIVWKELRRQEASDLVIEPLTVGGRDEDK